MINYDQTAEHWEVLMAFAGKMIAGTVPLVGVGIATWRKIKRKLAQRDKETDARALEAARKVAATAVDTTHQLAADVKRTIQETVGTDGDTTLRAVVQEQGQQLQAHVAQSNNFRTEILSKVESLREQSDAHNRAILDLLLGRKS